jgi:hypothetical protein
MFLHIPDISHIKDQAERQAMAALAENNPQIKLAPGQTAKVGNTHEGAAITPTSKAPPANKDTTGNQSGEKKSNEG